MLEMEDIFDSFQEFILSRGSIASAAIHTEISIVELAVASLSILTKVMRLTFHGGSNEVHFQDSGDDDFRCLFDRRRSGIGAGASSLSGGGAAVHDVAADVAGTVGNDPDFSAAAGETGRR